MSEKIEVSKELLEYYNENHKGQWGNLIRAWRYWLNNDLDLNKERQRLDNDLIDTININIGNGLPASDIIPMLITGEIEIVEKQEPKKWTVYFDQRYADSDIFRYFYWDGEHINQTDNLDKVPFLTGEQAQKAPSFMQSLVKRGK